MLLLLLLTVLAVKAGVVDALSAAGTVAVTDVDVAADAESPLSLSSISSSCILVQPGILKI